MPTLARVCNCQMYYERPGAFSALPKMAGEQPAVRAMRKRTDRRIGDLLGDSHALDASQQEELVQAFETLQVEQAAEWRCLWGCVTGAEQEYRAAAQSTVSAMRRRFLTDVCLQGRSRSRTSTWAPGS